MIGLNRNNSRIEKIEGEKIVTKFHKKPIFFQRELFFYNLFKTNPLIKIPEIYSSKKNDLSLQTYFIESEEKDFFKIAEEWAKVHSYFLNKITKENPLLIKHDLEEVSKYLSKNISLFGKLGTEVQKKISSPKMNKTLLTILHGDLQNKNMVTSEGENYYFDFELGGIGHPARDVASIIISNPDKKREIIEIYKQNSKFNYPGIGEDINQWLIARAAQLYLIFEAREGTIEQKRKIKDKLSKIIENN